MVRMSGVTPCTGDWAPNLSGNGLITTNGPVLVVVPHMNDVRVAPVKVLDPSPATISDPDCVIERSACEPAVERSTLLLLTERSTRLKEPSSGVEPPLSQAATIIKHRREARVRLKARTI